jgi:selenocysteine-specific elongation factor
VVRVRSLHVHDHAVHAARAGQRVAINLAGVARGSVDRGDVLCGAGAAAVTTHRVEASLSLHAPLRERERVQVHHGTRDTPARAVHLGLDRWQLRLERPVIAADGDRLVVRRISPPDTLGGGAILTAAAGGRHPVPAASPSAARVAPARAPATPPALSEAALALEARLRDAGHEPPSDAALGADAGTLRALRETGRAVRLGPTMHAHPDAIAAVRAVVERIARAEGGITLARLRDELGTSRKYAQALLEHFDSAHVTVRREDERRVLRGARRQQ